MADDLLADLRERLARTHWPEPIPRTGWEYGLDIGYVRELCEYWRTDYDWRAHERRLNAHAGFLCEVDGLDRPLRRARGARAPARGRARVLPNRAVAR